MASFPTGGRGKVRQGLHDPLTVWTGVGLTRMGNTEGRNGGSCLAMEEEGGASCVSKYLSESDLEVTSIEELVEHPWGQIHQRGGD